MVMNYSDVETKVREATNDETWGPHGTLMSEIAKYTFTYEHYPEVMTMLWKRMFETKKNWRRTYKVWEVEVIWWTGECRCRECVGFIDWGFVAATSQGIQPML